MVDWDAEVWGNYVYMTLEMYLKANITNYIYL